MEDAQGVMRGGCRECSCRRYVLPMVNRCDYCNHLPIAHQELPVAAPVPSSSSSTKLATSPRTKHLFQQQAPAPAPAEQVSKPHRHGSNTSSSPLATDPLESTATAAAAASLLAYVEAQLHKRNGTTPSLPPLQDPAPTSAAAATVLASQSSVDELLTLLRAHLAGAPPPSSSATAADADAATSPTPRTTPPPPQSPTTTSLVHTPSPASSLSSATSATSATAAANAGPGLLPTPLFPASPVLAPPPTPPPAAAAEANGVDCTATAAAPAVSAAGRRKKSAITAAAGVAAATKAVSVAAPPTTPAAPTAAAADGQLTAKKNRARKRSARARSRSKVGSGLELPHGADALSVSTTNGHPGDEEDDEAEAEAAFDDDHDRDEHDAEYADEPNGPASTSDQQPHEAHLLSDARDEAAQPAPTAITGGQQPESFVRRNTGGRRRPQPERAEELIPLSFLTNALFTPPPPQPQPPAEVPAPVETKRVRGVGTGDPKFSITIAKCVNKTLMFHTISAMPEYCGKSFEELRWEDYQLGNRGTQTRPSLFSLIDTSSPPYLLPSPSPAAAVDRAPSPPPASLLPRSLQGFFDSATDPDPDPDAQPPLDLLPPPPIPVASAGHSARDEVDADGGEEEEQIIYRTPSKSLLDDKAASAPSPLALTSSTPAPAPHKEVDAAQLAPGSRLRARNAANRTRVTRLYEELYELVEQLGRQVAAAGDDGDTTTPAPFSEADALLHRIHAATRDYAFAPTPPAASLFTSGTPLSPPLFALPPPPHSPYSPLASASAAAAAAMGASSPAPSPSPGFSALSPAPSAPVYTAFPPPASSPFALRSFPVPMDLSYFKRYYIKGSYVPFLEDFAHEFKDVARNKKEHYFAIINHPKLEANLSAFLNSRDGGTLYFGIHDSGQVIGVSITRDQLDSLKNMIWAKMETFNPVPDPHLYRIEIVPVCNARATALIKDLYVVEIHITGGTRLYFNREDRAWVRRDAGNHCLKSGAEVRDFIEQRGKERRQERRGEKRRSDHHDSPASSSSSTSMDTNLDDGGGGLTMRPLTPRAHIGGSGMRGTPESGSGGVGAATTTPPGPTSSATAALQSSPVPLLFPLRRPVHRDGRVAPVWLKTWSSTGPADGSQHATAAEAANPSDHLAAGSEATATASKKPKRATTPDNAAVDGVIANDEAETEVSHSAYTDATDSARQHDRERGGEVEAEVEEQGGDADRVQAAAAPDGPTEETTAAAPVGDGGLLDQGATNEETTDKREEEAAAENEENELGSHAAQEAENWEQKMRDLEADLARLSADTSELVSLSWIPTPEAAASSEETTAHTASPDLLKEATAPASELKERPASPAAAVGDDATTANTNTEDGADADVALATGADVPSAAALAGVDDNERQGESRQRKTDIVAEEEDHGGGEGGVEEAEEVKADEGILAFGPTLGVTNASTVPAPAAATGALPPFSFADFSSSFFSSFSLPSSLYSPSPSPYAPLSATNTTSAPTSSSSSSSSPPSSPSPSSSPALRSSTKRSLAAFLPLVGAKAGCVASPSLLPVSIATPTAAAAPLDSTPTPAADRGSTAETEEKKVGKNRRKKEQRMLKSNNSNRPATSTATDTDVVRPTKTDYAADGRAESAS